MRDDIHEQAMELGERLRQIVMAQDVEATCASCRLWRRYEGAHGYCRSGPPKLVQRDEYHETAWPTTSGSDFCGAWEPKSAEAS